MNKRVRKKDRKIYSMAVDEIQEDFPSAIVKGYLDRKTRNTKHGRAIRRAMSGGTLIREWQSWEFWAEWEVPCIGYPAYTIHVIGKMYDGVHCFEDAVDGEIDFRLRKFITSPDYVAQVKNLPEIELLEPLLWEITSAL